MKLYPVHNKPNLYRHPITNIIYFRMFRKGLGECVRSTGETVLAKAEIKAEEIRHDFLGERIKPKSTRRLFEDEWPYFLETKKTKSPGTYQSIEVQGRVHLMPFFNDKWPHEIDENLWAEYVTQSRAKIPDRKFFNDWKYLMMFLNYLKRTGKISEVPILKNPDPPRAKGKVYSVDEISRLLGAAQPDLKLQILMAVTMGMRVSEILFLSWERVDLNRKIIHLRAEDTKIRKARSFGISYPVFAILKLRGFDSSSAFVFPSPNDPTKHVGRGGNKTAWAACKRRAKVKGRFHWLRHTFLTLAFKKSVNPALICEYAGLSLEEAQKTYLHFDIEDTRPVSDLVVFK